MDRGAWQAAVHGVTKSRALLSDFTFTFHFHALEREMATHSSILAWRIPRISQWDGWMASPTGWTWVWVNSGSWWWTGRPGVLRFTGSQRVGHDWATELTDWLTQIYVHRISIIFNSSLVSGFTSRIGLVAKSCPTLATLWTVAHQGLCPWDSPGKNTGVGCHFLLQ